MAREHWHDWLEQPPPDDRPVQVIRLGWPQGIVLHPRATSPKLDPTGFYWRHLP